MSVYLAASELFIILKADDGNRIVIEIAYNSLLLSKDDDEQAYYEVVPTRPPPAWSDV
jgi:hypothetical protein